MSPNNLKYLIKKIVLQELKVDEPEGGPYGRVLFSPQRTDKVEEEPNTDEESKLFDAIKLHYLEGVSEDLNKFYRKILALIKKGKYKNLLAPPPGFVYRLLNNVSVEDASKILGLSINKLKRQSEEFNLIRKKKVLRSLSRKQQLQSWTLGPVSSTLSGTDYTNLWPGKVMLLAKSSITDGRFFMSPDFASKIVGLEKFSKEREVISIGPVKVSEVAYYVNEEKKYSDFSRILRGLDVLFWE